MRGNRWKTVKKDYNRCLLLLSKMENIIVTTLSFDDCANFVGREKPPNEALKEAEKLPFTGGETNYTVALNAMVNCIDKVNSKYKDYCSCLLFLSDGLGEYPENEIKRINEMKKASKKIVFYTIAFLTTDDETMKEMMKNTGGEHFKVKKADSVKSIFNEVLGI